MTMGEWFRRYHKHSRLFLLIGLSGALALPVLAQSSQWKLIDAEAAKIESSWDLTDNDVTYRHNQKGRYVAKPRIVSDAFRGSKALQLIAEPSEGCCTDKTEYQFVPSGDAHRIRFRADKEFEGPYYFGYAFKLHRDFETPVEMTMISQVWQGSPHSPPFSVQITPNWRKNDGENGEDILQLEFWVRNDATGTMHYDEPLVIGKTHIELDQWHTLAYEFVPSYVGETEPGSIRIWRNDVLIVDWRGNWGYRPAVWGGVDGANTGSAVLFNIYRDRQDTWASVIFDSLKYGNALEAVKP